LDWGKYLLKNFATTSSQLVRLFSGKEFNQAFAGPASENGKRLRPLN